MGPKTKLDLEAVLKRVGLKHSSWKVYVSQGKTPEPDGKFGIVRGHWWYAETIDAWNLSRRKHRGTVDSEGNFLLVNRQAYDYAARLIERGDWELLIDCGILLVKTGMYMNCGYLYTQFTGPDDELYRVLVHRLVWEWKTGQYVPCDPSVRIIHKNENRHDNRLVNLAEKE